MRESYALLAKLLGEMVTLAQQQNLKIKQLERDVEFLLAADATNKTRFAAMDDKQRRLEAEKMYGIRK